MAEKETDPIAKIDSKLGEYEADLSEKLSALKEDEKDVREKLRQVRAMRRAGGSGAQTEEPKPPAPKKTEVIQIVTSLLDAGPLLVEDLKEKVAARLRKTHTLTGLPLRMKEALGTDLFEADSTGLLRLAKKNTTSAERSQP